MAEKRNPFTFAGTWPTATFFYFFVFISFFVRRESARNFLPQKMQKKRIDRGSGLSFFVFRVKITRRTKKRRARKESLQIALLPFNFCKTLYLEGQRSFIHIWWWWWWCRARSVWLGSSRERFFFSRLRRKMRACYMHFSLCANLYFYSYYTSFVFFSSYFFGRGKKLAEYFWNSTV